MERIKRKFNTVFRVLKKHGFLGFIERIKIRIIFFIKGVDFSRIKLENIDEDVPNKKRGIMFSATTFHELNDSIKKIQKYDNKIFEGCFLDYGSGKGLTLYTAYKLGFKNVIGVEFLKNLCCISEKNLNKLIKNRSTIDVVHCDASIYSPKKNTRVIFFFNPFDDVIMGKVISNILKAKFTNDVYIIYYNSVLRDLFLENESINLLDRDETMKTDIYKVIKNIY